MAVGLTASYLYRKCRIDLEVCVVKKLEFERSAVATSPSSHVVADALHMVAVVLVGDTGRVAGEPQFELLVGLWVGAADTCWPDTSVDNRFHDVLVWVLVGPVATEDVVVGGHSPKEV